MMLKKVAEWMLAAAGIWIGAGCSPSASRHAADRVAGKIVDQKQQQALGRTEPFTIERPADTLRRRLLLDQHLPVAGPSSFGPQHLPPLKHLPADVAAGVPVPPYPAEPTTQPLRMTLVEALEIGAANNRDYQTRKESIYSEALRLDLERDEFRTTLNGLVTGEIVSQTGGTDVTGAVVSPSVGFVQRLENGAVLTGRIGLDLVRLLSGERSSSRGVFADASVTIPLLRGAGRDIVTEPLQQAERDVIYAIWDFEEFKRDFAVQVASAYMNVLQTLDQVKNAEDNYERLVASTRRARRLADAGRLPEVQVDQSVQQELRAREGWIRSQENYKRRVDSFKLLLGLPPDAEIALDRGELQRLTPIADRVLSKSKAPVEEQTPPADAPVTLLPPRFGDGGPLELPDARAVVIALANRLDLRVLQGRVYDAQRKVVVAANGLLPGLDLDASAALGARRGALSGASENSQLRVGDATYSGSATLDLPLKKTAERNAYRISVINLERASRSVQDLEDQVKLDVTNTLRDLLEAREGLQIQAQAVEVAQRRVASTTLLLEAGRVQIRDLLEAQDALLTASNAFTAALISYRVGELRLQQSLGVLEVNERGLWREFDSQKEPGQI